MTPPGTRTRWSTSLGRAEYAEVERRLEGLFRNHMLEINDDGFLPEGSTVQGYDASRKRGAYPLERIPDVADKAIQRDPAYVGIFVQLLNDYDPTVQRWAAMGLVMLASTKDIASAEGFADPPREALGECVEHNPFVRVPAAEALARLDGQSRGYEILVELIAPANERAVRIEALNALTFLSSCGNCSKELTTGKRSAKARSVRSVRRSRTGGARGRESR
jgi:hypothetical protein